MWKVVGLVLLLGLGEVHADEVTRAKWIDASLHSLKVSQCRNPFYDKNFINNNVEILQNLMKKTRILIDEDLYFEADKQQRLVDRQASSFAQAMFRIADGTLALGCLDIADRYYRGVVSVFIGNRYAGYRQRAQIGINDVRSRRSSSAR